MYFEATMSEVKKVAIISNYANSLVNFRGPLVRALADQGVTVFALAPDYDDDLRNAVVELGATAVDYELSRAGMNPARDAIDTLRLAALLRRLNPDATLGYFVKPVIYGTLAAWLAGVPNRFAMIEGLGFVFTESGAGLTFKRRMLRKGVSWLYRMALARAKRVIFLNPDDVAEFVQGGLVEREKTYCLGGIGVDLAEWPAMPVAKHPVTFLLVARLLREKGIAEYVQAAREVKRKYPQVRFVLLGAEDPNPGAMSRAEADAWVAEGVIEWPGHVPVKPWLEQASVYVLPSYREGVPRSTQEALAVGRPVITTDAPGCRETVIDGENGFLVPVRNSWAIAEKMIRFIENPELIESMGRRSRALAEERFDVHRINADLLRVMEITHDGFRS